MTQYEDEFHVTLPSNVSLDLHPENRPSNYVTELPHSINLNGPWEVAAMEVQFTREWYNLTKDHALGVNVASRSSFNGAMPAAHDPSNDLDEKLNKWREAAWKGPYVNRFRFRQVVVKRGYYKGVTELGEHVCKLINEAYDNAWRGLNAHFEYDAKNKTVAIQPADDYIIRIVALNDEFMKILGFKKSTTHTLTDDTDFDKQYAFFGGVMPASATVTAKNVQTATIRSENRIFTDDANPEGLADVRSIFLYSDVSGYQIVGDEKAPLIGVVPVIVKDGERTHWTFSPPYYSRVATNSFKSVRIWLTDHCGEEVKFSNASDFIVTRLHFRKKK